MGEFFWGTRNRWRRRYVEGEMIAARRLAPTLAVLLAAACGGPAGETAAVGPPPAEQAALDHDQSETARTAARDVDTADDVDGGSDPAILPQDIAGVLANDGFTARAVEVDAGPIDDAHARELLGRHYGDRFAEVSLSTHVVTLQREARTPVNGGDPVVLVVVPDVELRIEGPAPEPGEDRRDRPPVDGDMIAVFDLGSGDFIQAIYRER